ncbi:hypothetical protein Lal_00045610 [Lupinus albus]|uniref:Uncharacterized protein n=1 Tax=Lupinus albus TaxID=3870 RepID=A0A6A5NNQ8_LUPAL|nr:hypothetical protein Lalb_Chr14g0371221 [Lupinus albus]KAF1886378.1 hypothetical protein Lal_00045610 [Lupinus albus]
MDECNKRKRVPSPDSEPESKIHRVGLGLDDNSFETHLIRVDSCVNSFDSDLARVDSCVNSCESDLTRVDSGESCLNTETQDDLFSILDSETVVERDSAIQGLDSVIKSFEEEIFAPGSGLHPVDSNSVPDCSELQTNLNLGYLLEASDDELGLPPTEPESDKPGQVNPDGLDLTGFVDFEDDIPNYHVFGIDNDFVAECDGDNSGARTFTAADWLFDYTESLQAI